MLEIVATNDMACERMTVADYAAQAAQPSTLPEFAFTPKKEGWTLGCTKAEQAAAAPIGPMVPPTISKPRELHEKLDIGPIAEGWLRYEPFFKGKVEAHTKPPVGTVPTLGEILKAFEARAKTTLTPAMEIAAIEATQNLDLPTVQQELAAMGIGLFNLSSSSNDDDIVPEIAEPQRESTELREIDPKAEHDLQANHDARRYGTAYTTVDLAPVIQRIEWEKTMLLSDMVLDKKATLIVADGEVTIESPSHDPQLVRSMGKRLLTGTGNPTAEEVADMRAFAQHYGVVGSTLRGKPKGAQWPEQSMDDLGAEDMMKPEEVLQGPQELSLHWLTSDDPEFFGRPFEVMAEPSEYELWALEEAV